MARRVIHVENPKVDNLDILVLGEQDVLDPKATVYDVVLVTILDRALNLSPELHFPVGDHGERCSPTSDCR